MEPGQFRAGDLNSDEVSSRPLSGKEGFLSRMASRSSNSQRSWIMAERIDLIAENREDAGKGASRRLRRSGKIPAIIYGAGEPARTIAFDRNSLLRQMENKSFFSSVLTVQVDGKNQAAVVKDMQRHPAWSTVMPSAPARSAISAAWTGSG